MSASGQMPSDYGLHWTPEAVWPDYGAFLIGSGLWMTDHDRDD